MFLAGPYNHRLCPAVERMPARPALLLPALRVHPANRSSLQKPLQICTFVFNNFQDAPPVIPFLSTFCIVARGCMGTLPLRSSLSLNPQPLVPVVSFQGVTHCPICNLFLLITLQQWVAWVGGLPVPFSTFTFPFSICAKPFRIRTYDPTPRFARFWPKLSSSNPFRMRECALTKKGKGGSNIRHVRSPFAFSPWPSNNKPDAGFREKASSIFYFRVSSFVFPSTRLFHCAFTEVRVRASFEFRISSFGFLRF